MPGYSEMVGYPGPMCLGCFHVPAESLPSNMELVHMLVNGKSDKVYFIKAF